MATIYGGGINVYHSSPTISGNTITENESENLGGGIYSEYSSPTITGNTISKNEAKSGGGIFVYSFSAIITNNHIISNIATNYGGGIYIESVNSYSVGGVDSSDTDNFNTICGNNPKQVTPDNYPNNYIFTFCII
jgi:putative cofactor-binding repeat protein